MTLNIHGNVERVVSLTPSRIRLQGYYEDDISATVKIVPEKKYAFKITGVKSNKKQYVTYDLKKEKKSGTTEYLLEIKNISKKAGRYFDTVTLSTDSKIMPEIQIKIFGNLKTKAVDENPESNKSKS